MKMEMDESTNQYTTRFLKAAHETRLFNPKSHYLTAYFVVSCVKSVHKCFSMSWYSNHTESGVYTVQMVATLNPNILGGDYKIIDGGDTSFLCRKIKAGGSKGATYIQKKYHCKRHGVNRTHGTSSCFSESKSMGSYKNAGGKDGRSTRSMFYEKKNIPRKATDNKCKYGCGAVWPPGHRCDNYYKSDSYKQKMAKEDRVLLATSRNVNDNADDNGDVDDDTEMQHGEDDTAWKRVYDKNAFDCKYTDDSVNKRFTYITDNNFNLTTPIYIESIKMFGKIDTGSEITVLNISSFYKKLNKINNVSGTLKFLGNNNNCKRLDETVSYPNIIHAY